MACLFLLLASTPALALDLSFEATLSADSSSDPWDAGLPQGERGGATLRVMARQEGAVRLEGHLLLEAGWQEPGVALPSLPAAFRVEELRWEEGWGEDGRRAAEVDRLLASYEGQGWRVTAGRQAVAWGEGWFFNPLDLFGGFPLTALERTWRPGIAALSLTAGLGRFSELAVVGVPAPADGGEGSAAARLLLPLGRTSLTLVGGRVAEEGVAGAGWSADLSGSKVTLAHLLREGSSLTSAGWERQTGPETRLLVEAQRDGGGGDRAAAEGSLQLSPLWVGAAAVFLNLSDGSGLLRLDATRSLSDYADVRVGASGGWGERPLGPFPRSEFGSYPVTLFLLATASW